MSSTHSNIDHLRSEILALELQLSALRDQLEKAERQIQLEQTTVPLGPSQMHNASQEIAADAKKDWPLELDEYKRYGRQMILPEIGLPGRFSSGVHLQASYELQ